MKMKFPIVVRSIFEIESNKICVKIKNTALSVVDRSESVNKFIQIKL